MSLLNEAAGRRYLLDFAKETRHHKFTRVSPTVFAEGEAVMRRFYESVVQKQPSKGRTINA